MNLHFKAIAAILLLAVTLKLEAQIEVNSILDVIPAHIESEITIPLENDTVIYIDVPANELKLELNAHRTDRDKDGTYTFFSFGPFSIMEAQLKNGTIFTSIMRI